MRFCHYCILCLPITYSLLTTIKCSTTTKGRPKRSIDDNFSVLLNLYRMNPLKQSKVFKTFSNKMLLPNRAGRPVALHFDANESTGEKQRRTTKNLKQIEEMLHSKPRTQHQSRPINTVYSVENNPPEEFVAEKMLLPTLSLNEEFEKDFNDILGHIVESVETTDVIPTTFSTAEATLPKDDILESMGINEIKYQNNGVVVMR